VKKMNYYAVQNPWGLPKWLGAILGCAFGAIAIGSAVAIVQLTRPPAPPVAATPAVKAEPVVAAATPTPARMVKAPVAVADEAAPAPTKKHTKHTKNAKKKTQVALAKGPALSASKRATVLAKHDTKEKRHERDALDKLLGL
jgi:hypothetical protein